MNFRNQKKLRKERDHVSEQEICQSPFYNFSFPARATKNYKIGAGAGGTMKVEISENIFSYIETFA